MAIAKIELTCRCCGKTFTMRKECHNRAEADSFETWAKQNIDMCLKCRDEKLRSAELASVADSIDELPALTGSVKQISWASSIRADRIIGFNKNFDKSGFEDPEAVETLWRLALQEKTSAAWWIDNRNGDIDDFVITVLGNDADLVAKTEEALKISR